jgi:hypothetical protein
MKPIVMLLTLGLMAALPILHPAAGAAFACPPGLAKKDPPCVPPGQARRAGGDDGNGRHGHGLDRDNLYFLDDYPRYDLPALPYGQRYAVVDNQIVVIDAESYEVLQLIRLFTALTD